MPSVRISVPSDIPALMHLLEQVNLVHHLGRPDLFRKGTKYGPEELSAILSDPDTPVFVCEQDGNVLGHAFCIVERVQNNRLLCDRTTLYIDDICVDETARHTGVGSLLYDAAVQYAKSIGCYNITLNVWTCNPGALAFYESLGLKPQKIGMEMILSGN